MSDRNTEELFKKGREVVQMLDSIMYGQKSIKETCEEAWEDVRAACGPINEAEKATKQAKKVLAVARTAFKEAKKAFESKRTQEILTKSHHALLLNQIKKLEEQMSEHNKVVCRVNGGRQFNGELSFEVPKAYSMANMVQKLEKDQLAEVLEAGEKQVVLDRFMAHLRMHDIYMEEAATEVDSDEEEVRKGPINAPCVSYEELPQQTARNRETNEEEANSDDEIPIPLAPKKICWENLKALTIDMGDLGLGEEGQIVFEVKAKTIKRKARSNPPTTPNSKKGKAINKPGFQFKSTKNKAN